jgi:uracil phosphoribosyltransferase
MGKLHVIDHPLVQHKLSLMRDKTTGTKDFRELLQEVATLMAYEVTRDLPLKEVEIETPIGPCRTRIIDGRMLGIIPILRAGWAWWMVSCSWFPARRWATSASTATR